MLNELTNSTGEQVALLKSFAEFIHTDSLFIHDVLCRTARKETRELVIEVDKSLSNSLSLSLIGLEDRSARKAFDNVGDFPTKVESWKG
jgi:hypothetical protein